jgi:ATP-dependent DNA helicase RecG
MSATLKELDAWLSEPEGERLEFKEAKANFPFEKLVKYCAALANEGGGKIILGVTDGRPRRVVGSAAFEEPGRTVASLIQRLGVQVTSEEIHHSNGRVLVFHVSSRPVGVPIQCDGVFWSRAGDELRPLSPDRLRRVFQESGPDFSAELHPDAGLADLDPAQVERFREMWMRKSGNAALASITSRQLLEDSELVAGDKVTHAALVLLGTRPALGRRLAQAELIFEYRSSEASIPFQKRIEFRSGFLGYLDELWTTINLRNEVLQYREGFFVGDIPAFNEAVVREAALNALAHRDYRLPGSIFVRQFPRRLEIVSPAGSRPASMPRICSGGSLPGIDGSPMPVRSVALLSDPARAPTGCLKSPSKKESRGRTSRGRTIIRLS